MPAWWAKKTLGRAILRNLALAYVGNWAGCVLVAYFLTHLAELSTTDPYHAYIVKVATTKIGLGWGVAFLRGVGANWLVCLAIWYAFTCLYWKMQIDYVTFIAAGVGVGDIGRVRTLVIHLARLQASGGPSSVSWRATSSIRSLICISVRLVCWKAYHSRSGNSSARTWYLLHSYASLTQHRCSSPVCIYHWYMYRVIWLVVSSSWVWCNGTSSVQHVRHIFSLLLFHHHLVIDDVCYIAFLPATPNGGSLSVSSSSPPAAAGAAPYETSVQIGGARGEQELTRF